MKRVWIVLGLALAAAGPARASNPPGLPPCEPGYTYVEETCYKECTVKVCKAVPDVKKTKKTVYAMKSEDFCLPRCRMGLFGCKSCDDGCTDCGKPRCKRILVKKEVAKECPTTKCVVEEVVQRVPYTVWRKVPCADAAPPAK